jgi:hypothetical protein
VWRVPAGAAVCVAGHGSAGPAARLQRRERGYLTYHIFWGRVRVTLTRSLKHPGGAKSGFYGFGLGARFLSVIVRSRLLSSEPERSRLEHTVNGRGNGVNKQP